MIWIWVSCLLVLYLTYKYKTWGNYWKSRGIPHQKPLFIFGNLYKVVTRKEHLFERIRSIYQQHPTPIVGIFIFHKPVLLLRSPEILRKILVKDFDKFENRVMPFDYSTDPLAYYTLFFARSKTWKTTRAKFSPVFTTSKIKSMFKLMQDSTGKFCSHLRRHDGEVIEVKDLLKRFSTDLIAACVFGISTDCYTNENSEIFKMASPLLDPRNNMRSFSMFCYFFLIRFVNLFKLTFADKVSSDYLGKIFHTMCTERQNLGVNDFVDSVLILSKENIVTREFDHPEVVSQALTFFGAGTDTTAILLSFLFYELSIDERIQDRLRKEILTVETLTYEAVQEMKYLDMVVKEALRKYPLSGILLRLAEEDYFIEETGFTIEKGTTVLVPVSGLHYDPEYYPEPHKFDPEQFSDENKSKIPNFTYLPFGDGPRYCIGQKFALSVIKVTLANLLKNFRFEAVEETVKSVQFDPEYTTLIENKADLYLRIISL